MDKLRVFESFSGVGSQVMALRNIGVPFEVVGISEVDKWALLAYDSIHKNNEEVEHKTKEEMLEIMNNCHIAYNFSTGKNEMPRNESDIRKLYEAHIRCNNFGDIALIDEKKLPDFDLFTYSFPCKNISVAGQQAGLEEGSGTQSALVWECKRIISEKLPQYLMMENVKNLVGKRHKPLFDLWCKTLEELGYVNYWKVLNGKNFNVPQNRERVIMISIRKDVDKEFQMPDGREDNGIRLKDILEGEVDSKYYINSDKLIFDDKMLKQLSLIGASRGRYVDEAKTITKQHLEVNQKGVCNSLTTVTTDNLVVEENKLIQVGMLNERGNESNRRVYSEEGLSPTLNSMNGGNRQPKIMKIDISQKVRIRKYEVDIESLKSELRAKKTKLKLTNKNISDKLNKPITLVEHWFRNDSCFSIPDEDIWDELKNILNIEHDYYDESIKEFIEKEGEYEKSNRCYHQEGISPTITVGSADEKIIINDKSNFVVRKLTPLECWRLMGYTDKDFYKAKNVANLSNSKLYERAGRGIVVPMLEDIFTELFKEYIVENNN